MKKKRILLIIIVIAAVLVIITSVLAVKRNRMDYSYERPQGLSPDAVIVLFMDSLNECNEETAHAFVTEECRKGTMIKDGWKEVSKIQWEKESDSKIVGSVDYYEIEKPILRPDEKEERNWDFVLEKSEKDTEWYITSYGEG